MSGVRRWRALRVSHAILGFALFGVAAPLLVIPRVVGEEGTLYWFLGFIFSAYAGHSFLTNVRVHRAVRWCGWAAAVLAGATYGAWIDPAVSLVGALAHPFESEGGVGVPDGYAVTMAATPAATGCLMASLLWWMTGSKFVGVVVAAVSVAVGLMMEAPITGWIIGWHVAVAGCLYGWSAALAARSRSPATGRECPACGYDLRGLSSDAVCPECGANGPGPDTIEARL